MLINKAYKIRIYPNKSQKELINKTLGCSRFIYNQMLAERIRVYGHLKNNKELLYKFKYKTEKEYKEEFEWLKEVDSVALQQARKDLLQAFQNFYRGLRKGQKIGFPNFKKKKMKCSYRTIHPTTIRFEKNKIILLKLKGVKYKSKRKPFEGKIKSATVSRSATGKYYVSVLYEIKLNTKGIIFDTINENQVIGLDMSLGNFYVDNNGNSPKYEKLYRENEAKLQKAQRILSRKKRYSNNWYKQLLRVNKIYEKTKNKRNDFTHKLSNSLVNSNTVICVENLSLQGISQGLNFGKSVNDLGYREFIRQLEYKCLWNDKILLKADKFYPSSKTCSNCGYKNSDLQLSDRTWICPECGEQHDRDKNAAINLKNYAIREISVA